MASEYDEIGAEMLQGGGFSAEPAPTPAATPEPTPAVVPEDYDDVGTTLFKPDMRQLKSSVIAGTQADPEKEAKLQGLAKKLNLPKFVIENNYDELSQFASRDENEYDTIAKETPGLAKYLSTPDNAAVSHDDIGALSKIDKKTQFVTKKKGESPFYKISFRGVPLLKTETSEDFKRAAQTGFHDLEASSWLVASAYGLISPEQAAEYAAASNKSADELRAKIPDYSKDFNKAMEERSGDLRQGVDLFSNTYEALKEEKTISALLDFGAGGVKTTLDLLQMIGSAAIRPRGLMYSTVENLANSAPALVGGAIGGGAAGLVTGAPTGPGAVVTGIVGTGLGSFSGGVMTEIGAEVNQGLRSRGVDVTNPAALKQALSDPQLMSDIRSAAQRKGISTAAVDAVFNIFAGRIKVTKGVGVGAKATNLAANTGVQMVGESASEGAGQIAREAGKTDEQLQREFGADAGKKKSILSRIDPGDIALEGIISMGQGVSETVVMGAVNRVRSASEIAEDAQKTAKTGEQALTAVGDAQALNEIGEAVQESKTAQRMPEKIQQLVTEGGPASVFFQATEWDDFWTSRGKSPVEAAEQLLGAEGNKKYIEAKSLGHEIEIPLSNYIAGAAMTEDFQGLNEIAITREGGMNLKEAQTTIKNLPATMQELVKEAAAIAAEDFVERGSAREVGNQVYEQLKAMGIDEKEARSHADVFEARYATRASILGKSPGDVFKARFESPETAAPTEDGQVLNQEPNSKEFKGWFSGSQVVDSEGQPQRLYHGTDKSFEEQKSSKSGLFGPGFYFTDNPVEAAAWGEYAATDRENESEAPAINVRPSYVKISNPVDIGGVASTEFREKAFEWAGKVDDLPADESHELVLRRAGIDGAEIQKFLKSLGYDGVKLRYSDEETHWVAFDKEQVRAQFEGRNFDQSSTSGAAPTFYSKLVRTIEEKMGTSATVEQIRGMLKDIKDAEKKWLGLDDFLKDKENVSKEELLAHLQANQLEVKEVTLSDGKPGQSEQSIDAIEKLTARQSEVDVQFKELTKDYPTIGDESKMPEDLRAQVTALQDEYQKIQEHIEKIHDGGNPYEYVVAQAIREWQAAAKEAGHPQVDQLDIMAGGYPIAKLPEALQDPARKLSDARMQRDNWAAPTEPDRTKYSKYTLPGGENYREVLFTLPVIPGQKRADVPQGKVEKNEKFDTWTIVWDKGGREGGFASQELAELELKHAQRRYGEASTSEFQSSHWEESNVFAHTRLKDQVGPNGEKILHVDEIQSDWDLTGRQKGFKEDAPALPPGFTVKEDPKSRIARWQVEDTEGRTAGFGKTEEEAIADYHRVSGSQVGAVPDFPFRRNWHEYTLKRIIRMAAEGGYDMVTWTTGEQQQARYPGIAQAVSKVEHRKVGEDLYEVVVFNNNGSQIVSDGVPQGPTSSQKLASLLGKDVANRIVNNEGDAKLLKWTSSVSGSGEDATIEYISADSEWSITKNTNKEFVIYDGSGNERGKGSSLIEAKEIAAKHIDIGARVLTGDNLKIGGKGKETLYDQIIPSFMNKLGKKFGAKVGDTQVAAKGAGAKSLEARENRRDGTWSITTSNGTIYQDENGGDYSGYESEEEANEILGQIEIGSKKTSVHSIPLTPQLKDAALNEGFSLFQGGPDDPRGRIILKDNEKIIQLFKGKNRSTLIHESGHLFLDEMTEDYAALSALPEEQRTFAQNQLVKDGETLLKWFGIESFKDVTVEHHEKFARGWEAYAMEGKAPTQALREAFTRFKVWLLSIYRSVKNLNVELTPEVRGVFDRMLAVQEEIDAAQQEYDIKPLFEDPAAFGMAGAKGDRYIRATIDAQVASHEALEKRLMEDLQREQRKEWKEEREKVRAQVDEQVSNQPVYVVLTAMRKGMRPDGTAYDVAPPKISKEAVIALYGPERVQMLPADILVSTKTGEGGVVLQGGIDPNIAAELYGFESGEALLSAIEQAPDQERLIESMTDEEMQTRHPELISQPEMSDEAIKALHNEKRSDLLMMELEHLASENLPVLGDVIRQVTKKPVPIKAVREQAARIIGTKTPAEIKPNIYLRAETKARREAGEAVAKGDFDAAFEAKQRELLNHELFMAAVKAKDDIAKSLKKFKPILKKDADLAKTREMDLVNAARAMLANFGLGKTDKTVADYLEHIQKYDPDTYQVVLNLVQSVPGQGDYQSMSYDDFVQMKTTVMALWDLSKSTKEIEIDGKKVELDAAVDALSTRALEVADKGKKKYDVAYGEDASKGLWLLNVKAAMRRVESWVDLMDGGVFTGAFRTYLLNPITDAIPKYRTMRKDIYKQFAGLLEQHYKKGELTEKEISAPELGQTARFKNKAALMHAVLHSGNESNLSKLLRGYGWGSIDENGILDRTKWDKFVKRMWDEGVLTKNDYDFAQKIWDLMDSMKPMTQKAHKQMYGHYFSEITADEVVTPFGTYRGGYVPATPDASRAQDAAIRKQQEELEQNNNSFRFPTTGRGATKSRVDAYAAPLELNILGLRRHFDWALRFSILEPAVKQVARVVFDRRFRAALGNVDPAVAGEMLVPWLQRTARQQVETPGRSRELDHFLKELRSRTGLQFLAVNLTNALQNIATFPVLFTKVKARYVRDAMWLFTTHPKAAAEMVAQKSQFMETKMTNAMADIFETLDDMLMNPSKYDKAVNFSSKHAFFLSAATQSIMDTVTWAAAYGEAIANGETEKQAVRMADSTVRLVQGSGAAEDVSRFESGTPLARVFTIFQTFFNTQANLLGTEFAKPVQEMGLKKSAGRLLFVYTMGFMLPSVLTELIGKAMSGNFDEDDDDEYMDEFVKAFFWGQFKYATALVPGAGAAVASAVNYFNDKRYDDGLTVSPAFSLLETGLRAPKSIYDMFEKDKGSKKQAIKDTLTLLGVITKLPLAGAARPLGYVTDIEQKKIKKPSGPIDAVRGFMTGKGEPTKKKKN